MRCCEESIINLFQRLVFLKMRWTEEGGVQMWVFLNLGLIKHYEMTSQLWFIDYQELQLLQEPALKFPTQGINAGLIRRRVGKDREECVKCGTAQRSKKLFMKLCNCYAESSLNLRRPAHGPFTKHHAYKITSSNLIGWFYAISRVERTCFHQSEW